MVTVAAEVTGATEVKPHKALHTIVSPSAFTLSKPRAIPGFLLEE